MKYTCGIINNRPCQKVIIAGSETLAASGWISRDHLIERPINASSAAAKEPIKTTLIFDAADLKDIPVKNSAEDVGPSKPTISATRHNAPTSGPCYNSGIKEIDSSFPGFELLWSPHSHHDSVLLFEKYLHS
jgi:hypothetical protein